MARSTARSSAHPQPAPLAEWGGQRLSTRPLQRAAQGLKAQPLRPSRVVMILLVWALATASLPLAG